MPDAKYTVTFTASGIAPVTVVLGDDPPAPASGYGGWTVVSRQRRIGLTVWQGKDPLRLPIAVIFDGYEDRTSQEVPISRLSRMALPPSSGGEPPTVKVTGAGLPNYGPAEWVIENLQWGKNVIRDFAANGVMARLRQDCVVNLLEYRGDDRTMFKGLNPGSKNKGGQSTSGWPKTYHVKAGDTLRKIAQHYYHDATKWKQIAEANKIRDPAIVAKGKIKTLRIPAP
jgi:hypothetical protein